ncbi:MAG: hypothetical protein MUC95_09460, partial [Spirochaetes bacterium]|nr:hypothetical protein [Spirochaetota bacterium]
MKKQFQVFLLTADIIIIYFSLFAAVYLRFGDFNYYDSYILDIRLIIIIGIYIIILYAMDGYNIDKVFKKNFFIIQYSTTFIMIGFAIASLIYMIPDIKYGRGIWLLQLLFSSVLIIAWRYVFELMHAKISKRNLAVIGYNEAGIEIANIIDKTRYYSFSGFIYNRQIKAAGKNYRFLGATKDIINIINMNNISAIVLCDNNITDKKFEKNIIDVKMKGVDIYDVPMIFELID